LKIPNTKWSWLAQHRRPYSEGARGNIVKKFGVEWVPHYEKGKYDVALLHLDQQCLDTNLWEIGKGSVYRELNEVITDIPKILLMHGTPFYPENFPSDITEENYEKLGFTKDQIRMSSELIKRFKMVAKGNYVLFNSHKARKQWGFENDPDSQTIVHGMDPEEWFDLPKEPRVVTMISPGGLDKYYDRTFLAAVKEELQEKDIYHCHITVDASFKNWDEYREFLGRSLLYFNPTLESPMPRARTEAMLSGCCVLTTPHQDADTFIEDGVNGFIVKRNPQSVVKKIEELLDDYKLAIKIGQAGKKTALEIFNPDRYQNDWTDLLTRIIK